MSSQDASSLLNAAKWNDEGFYLKEFLHKAELPQVVKIIKGHYVGLGVSSISNPSLQSNIFLASTGKKVRVAAQCVKFKDHNTRVVPHGPRLAIPDTFEGYFEILSEDGRAVRAIESVAELSRRFPDSVLVRETVRAFVSRSDDVETIEEKTRTIHAGETLILVGEVIGRTANNNNSGSNNKPPCRFLRCFDSNGENVYLPYDTRGRFSPIAKEDNISGVHSIKNLLNKRMPLMVRLVHGKPPVGLKSGHTFLPVLRLHACISEESYVALALQKDSQVIPLPSSAPLKVQPAKNSSQLKQMKEFARISEKCLKLECEISDRIQLYDVNIAKEKKLDQMAKIGGPGGISVMRKSSLPINSHNHNHHLINSSGKSKSQPDDYDEIDQIYDYVRGFAPLPKAMKNWVWIPEKRPVNENHYQQLPVNKNSQGPPLNNASPSANNTNETGSGDQTSKPPDPPPIETIPKGKPSLTAVNAAEGGNKALSPMELSPPTTPPYSPGWSPTFGGPHQTQATGTYQGRPLVVVTTPSPGGTMIDRTQSKSDSREARSDNKKRSRPKTTESRRHASENVNPNASINGREEKGGAHQNTYNDSSTVVRYIKSANHKNTHKHNKLFRHKSSSPMKEAGALVVASTPNNLGSGIGSHNKSSSGASPLFNLRYKSLTNLHQQHQQTPAEYDTLDSSNSGGKTSADSGGSKFVPEKRSRRFQALSRPKSLTNLVWDLRGMSDFRGGGPTQHAIDRCSSKPSLIMETERRMRLEPGVFCHSSRRMSKDFSSSSPNSSASATIYSKKLVPPGVGSKRIGTLYL